MYGSIIFGKDMNELYLRYKSVSVFADTAARISPLAELTVCVGAEQRLALAARVFRDVAESGCDNTGGWIKSLIQTDDNFFSRAVAKGERVSDKIKAQVKSELLTFKQLSLIKPDDFTTDENRAFFPNFGFGGFSVNFDVLSVFYAVNGCGWAARGSVFTYRDGRFDLAEYDGLRLSDLKDYDEEKSELVRNTQNFISGLPAFHTMLYGDPGTGRSATVRALANEYKTGLKIIEIGKNDIKRLPDIISAISGLKQKFILFADGVAAEEDMISDADKSALERALDGAHDNYLVYCTSDAVNNDGVPKSDPNGAPALFDRFGLVITYLNPDREKFAFILKQILRSRGIKWRDEYFSVAELATVKRGAGSPHAAKQIADLIEYNYAERMGG